MSEQRISEPDRQVLLQLARQSIEMAVNGEDLPELDLGDFSQVLQTDGASFVTLTQNDHLRGCIGTLEAYQPLVQDVCEHAAAAALEDYRFLPVRPYEVPSLRIEISCLSLPQPLVYSNPAELATRLRPGLDGVVLKHGRAKATFLPQVWEQLPSPEEFLDNLCVKMGTSPSLWRKTKLDVSIYQVEEFQEAP